MTSNLNPRIDILLATYNGERFIQEQLDSLLAQSYENWKIIIRDDGSSDNTLGIVGEFIKKHGDRIELIDDGDKGLGPSGNFARLLENSTAQYIMFCDQDDVWKEDKIKLTFEKMKEIENNGYKDKPILVHTDLEVVNKELETVADSMFQYQNLNSNFVNLNNLLTQNNVTGCTTMINESLKEKALPISKNAMMHDWWLALVASAFGKIGFVSNSTIKYRQHGGNDTGAKQYSFSYFYQRVKGYNKLFEMVNKNFKQAESFYLTYKSELTAEMLGDIEHYIELKNINKFKRVQVINKYGFLKQGMIRNIGFFIIVFMMNKEKII
ncbi:glycosyltransferase family 2 protein [Bacillus cereus]|uniref:Glycosyl transferase family 2 n=1 Tax=Bacillus cereus TaxID=1396 RepID=A0A9X7GQG3_BACCE|nr:glycosyltransferase family 2 protein [Bacillus cereus]MBF8115727.1 glycosyltransferase family 2 protein [Bacillus cereus]MCC3684742.1 glycosyltransferase family 2 protein [Bacillus cereus]NIL12473.1 glycosyltransferase family 2 protein [Bacillus cereus]PGO77882.1 glycosyl transferase family 2 [Bacillus cereus]HDR6476898.1 glycosyltransferase family 2 protein [Bacillus cereus]